MNLLTTTPAGSGFTFSRASAATKLDGSSVASGEPRYESAPFGRAIMVEEGTTNLLAGANAEVGSFTSLVVTVNHPATGLPVKAIKLPAGDDTPVSASGALALAIDTDYTLSFDYWASDNANPQVQVDYHPDTLPETSFAPTTSLQHFTWTVNSPLAAMGNCTVRFFDNSAQPMTNDVYITNIQLEAKPYATSFINGSRDGEVCSIPAATISPTSFTVEFDVLITPHTKRQIANSWPGLIYLSADAAIHGGGKTRMVMVHQHNSADFTVEVTKNGVTSYLPIPDSVVPDGNRRFAFRCDGLRFDVFVDGINKNSTTDLTNLPTAFTILYVGSLFDFANTLYSGVRISNRARTSAEILAATGKPLTLDADTTALLVIPAASAARVLSNDGNTVQLDCPPIRPARKRRDSRQLRETASDGAPVVYGKGDALTVYGLTFPRCSTVTLASLYSWVAATVKGVRRAFTWIDHTGTAHDNARLTSSRLRSTPAGPNQHRVEIEIEVNE